MASARGGCGFRIDPGTGAGRHFHALTQWEGGYRWPVGLDALRHVDPVPNLDVPFPLVADTDLERTRQLGGQLLDPIKTTNVQQQRCMTTWTLGKA